MYICADRLLRDINLCDVALRTQIIQTAAINIDTTGTNEIVREYKVMSNICLSLSANNHSTPATK